MWIFFKLTGYPTIQFNSNINHLKLAQDCFHFRSQSQVPGCHLYFQPINYKFRVPTTPFEYPIISWNGSKLKETFYLLLLVYFQGYNSGTTKLKTRTGQGMGKGTQIFSDFSGHVTLPEGQMCLATQKLSKCHPLRVCLKVPLHRYDWLNTWLLMIKLNLQPLLSPWRSRWNWKSQHCEHMVLLATSPNPEAI